MKIFGACVRCQGRLAILDILMEGYDLICTRCGERQQVIHRLIEPPPCLQ